MASSFRPMAAAYSRTTWQLGPLQNDQWTRVGRCRYSVRIGRHGFGRYHLVGGRRPGQRGAATRDLKRLMALLAAALVLDWTMGTYNDRVATLEEEVDRMLHRILREAGVVAHATRPPAATAAASASTVALAWHLRTHQSSAGATKATRPGRGDRPAR